MAMPLSHIGTLEDFSKNFSTICQEHVLSNRAKGFVFIFENPKTQKLRKSGIHNSDRAVIELNKIAGEKLTIFYLDNRLGNNREYASRVDNFNNVFIDKISFTEEVNLPCLLFFRINKHVFSDFEAFPLHRMDLGFIYNDIKSIIQDLADRVDSEEMDSAVPSTSQIKVRMIKGLKHYSIESFKILLAGATSAITSHMLGM